jgi:hypothetical protein
VKEFDKNAVETVRGSQITFSLIDPKDPTFEFDLEHWFNSFKARSEVGVFFVATKGKEEGAPGEILVFHHWLVMEGTAVPDMIGIESFEAASTFRGVKSVKLFGKLIAHRGARKAGASNFFVPSLDGLIGFAVGVDVLPAKINRQALQHQVRCAQELINSDKELYGEEEDDEGENKQDEEDSIRGSRNKGQQGSGSVLGLELLTRGSPRSKGTASPSVRRDRTGVSFEDILSTDGEDRGETKEPEPVEAAVRETRIPEDAPDIRLPDGAPEWAGHMAGQFMAGFIATTKALTAAGKSLGELAKVNKKSLDEKEEMKLATFKWLKSGEFLLKVLSTEDGWNTQGIPELTDFAQTIIKMKLFAVTQHIRAQAKEEEWPGGLLKSGVSEFLKRGFVAEDVQIGPSGFSVLFFHPSSFTETDGEEFGIQQLRESFGDGKLPEEMMKTFSKLNVYIPKNTTYEAAEQVETAIRFLKCLCGENTIAVGGYNVGFQHLTRSCCLFEAKDKLFLLNYMYMLDRVFQSFCSELKKYIMEEDPIQVAKTTGAQRWMEKLVENPVQNWKVTGTIPMYSSPSAWDERKLGEGVVDLSSGKGQTLGSGGAPSPPQRKKKAEKGSGEDKELPWHRSLEPNEYVKEWFLPSPNKFFQYFNPDRSENFVGLPMVTHHRTGRKAYICVRYIVGNGPGCN